MSNKMKNNRGVALLIVLLVTALLIALIFEFAYATRISLNSAINFRDSQRAYFLARSGIYAFIKYGDLKKNIRQGEWSLVPLISEGDTLVRIMWEDEQGKINISTLRNETQFGVSQFTFNCMVQLFSNKTIEIDQDILDRISTDKVVFHLPGELHQVMSDADYTKIAKFVTTMTTDSTRININTASREVLESIGIPAADAERIAADQGRIHITISSSSSDPSSASVKRYIDETVYNKVQSNLTDSSSFYKVYSYATVGGYTKKIEAVVNTNTTSDRSILYWRAL